MINTNFTINGYNINDDTKTLKVVKTVGETNSSSNFSAVIDNYGGLNAGSYAIGNEVIVYADQNNTSPTNIIFRGILENVSYPGAGLNEQIQLTGRGYEARLMDNIVEPEVFTNISCGSIVKTIVNKYVTGITVNNVVESDTAPSRIGFSNTTVFDAIKKLRSYEEKNYTFYIDSGNDLHYEPSSATSSGYTLGSDNVLKCSIKEDRTTIFNDYWIYGDKYKAGYKDTFTGDGTGSVFYTTYKPSDTEIFVDDVIQKGGVLEMNEVPVSGTNYLISYDERMINFVSGTDLGYDSTPASGASIVANYNRDLPVIKYGFNPESVIQYGKRTKIIVDKNIKDPLTAQLRLEKELNDNSYPEKEGNVDLKGFYDIIPSETVVVNMPFQDINNVTYDVIQVTYDFNKNTCLSEQVQKLKVNKKIGDLTDRIKDIEERLKQLEGADTLEPDILPKYIYNLGSIGIRQTEIKVYTATNTGSVILCSAAGLGIDLTGTLASGTYQRGLAGSPNASPYADYQVIWSGGYV